MFQLEDNTGSFPFIVNDCTRPPANLIKHLKESLSLFSEDELNGLGDIRLHDQMPDGPEQEYTFGFYFLKTENSAPCIVLFINNIYRSLRDFPFCKYTPVPTLCISKTLAHEVAHHLIATRGFVFEPGEDVNDQEWLANQYAQKHLEKMRVRLRYRFGFWLMLQWAELLYSAGVVYSTKHKYCEAADCWLKAWSLNPTLKNVSEWYHLAREDCNRGKKAHSLSTNQT